MFSLGIPRFSKTDTSGRSALSGQSHAIVLSAGLNPMKHLTRVRSNPIHQERMKCTPCSIAVKYPQPVGNEHRLLRTETGKRLDTQHKQDLALRRAAAIHTRKVAALTCLVAHKFAKPSIGEIVKD